MRHSKPTPSERQFRRRWCFSWRAGVWKPLFLTLIGDSRPPLASCDAVLPLIVSQKPNSDPPPRKEAAMAQPLARRFAEYAARLRYEDLPAPVVHEANRRFIDSFATAVGAMDADAFKIAHRCALNVQGNPSVGL